MAHASELPAEPLHAHAVHPAHAPTLLHVLVLVGIVGSGKSTFATAVAETLGWVRCNQDELGRRAQVVAAAEAALAARRSVVVDRTNLDETQRAHWIDVAHAFQAAHPDVRVAVSVIELYVPHEVAHARLASRTHHPTLQTPAHAHRVLGMCERGYRPPRADVPEGFAHMLAVRGDQLDLSDARRAETVHAVINALLASPALPPPSASFMRAVRSRGGGRGDGRGRGRGARPGPRPASAASPASRRLSDAPATRPAGGYARGPQSRP